MAYAAKLYPPSAKKYRDHCFSKSSSEYAKIALFCGILLTTANNLHNIGEKYFEAEIKNCRTASPAVSIFQKKLIGIQ